MGKKHNRKYLESAAQPPRPETNFIDPNLARQLPIIFGFKHLNLDKKPFHCTLKHAEGMLYILNTLRLFSGVVRVDLERSFKNCHLVPDDQIKKHNLEGLISVSPNKRLHQLGRKGTPERIIGYFDSPNANLFQACLLDLEHSLSGK